MMQVITENKKTIQYMSKDYCKCTGRGDELKEALDALKVGLSLVVHGKPGIGKSTFLKVLEEKASQKWCTYAFAGMQRQHFADAVKALGGGLPRAIPLQLS